MVPHVHVEQWEQRFEPLVATAGRLLEHRLMPLAYRGRQFVCVSASTREALAAVGVEPARIAELPCGVEAPASQWLPPRSSEPLFVALGRLVANKRIELLLRAWEQVRPVTGGRLLVIGDGPERDRLQVLAGEGVTFAGRVDDAEKWRLLASSWLLLHVSMREGWGIAVMEAAAVATPSIGFNVLGVSDAIVDGVSGVLVASEDELIATWIRLAQDGEERNRLSDGAIRRAAEFTPAHTVDEFEKVLQRAVQN
jgi:glycosyltransferase involved in cell wall biosynthesis